MRNPDQFSKLHVRPVRDVSDCLDEFFTSRGRSCVIDIHAREGKGENVVFNLCGQKANTVPSEYLKREDRGYHSTVLLKILPRRARTGGENQ